MNTESKIYIFKLHDQIYKPGTPHVWCSYVLRPQTLDKPYFEQFIPRVLVSEKVYKSVLEQDRVVRSWLVSNGLSTQYKFASERLMYNHSQWSGGVFDFANSKDICFADLFIGDSDLALAFYLKFGIKHELG